MYDGLLLDIGGVILDPWQALDAYATATGVPVPGRGPIDPEGDPLWKEKLSGALTLSGYWDRVARRTGHDDWRTIESREFFDARPAFEGLDAFVDASDIGVGKPEPDAYLIAAEALGLAAERIVFLDDAEENVEGARAVGMHGIQVDAGSASTAFDKARELLGLAS
jgi:hypothetical protein